MDGYKWVRSLRSDHSAGLNREDLPEFLRLIKTSLNLPSEYLSEGIIFNIQEIATNCGPRGLTSTVYGDLNDNTAFYGLFHCAEAEDGTIAISFATHKLYTDQARPKVLPAVKVQQGIQEDVTLGTGWTADNMAGPAIEELRRMGVHIDTGREENEINCFNNSKLLLGRGLIVGEGKEPQREGVQKKITKVKKQLIVRSNTVREKYFPSDKSSHIKINAPLRRASEHGQSRPKAFDPIVEAHEVSLKGKTKKTKTFFNKLGHCLKVHFPDKLTGLLLTPS